MRSAERTTGAKSATEGEAAMKLPALGPSPIHQGEWGSDCDT